MPGPCHRCGRQVYSAEERLALSGSSWHQECFTCAVCNKSLDSTNLAENHENKEIYCKNCYRILYGTKGYGYGPNEPTLIANTGPLEDCCPETPTTSVTNIHQCPGKNTPVIVKPFEQIPFRKGFIYWGRHPTPRHYGHQVIPCPPRVLKKCDPEEETGDWPILARSRPSPQCLDIHRTPPRESSSNCLPPPRRQSPMPPHCKPLPPQGRPQTHCPPVPPPNCRVMSRPQAGRPKTAHHNLQRSSNCSSSANRSNHGGPGPELCARCGKPVYFAEKKIGYHGVYHARCYVCCSCGKSLESTTVSESNGVLYCKGCYKRYVATDGVGFGLGAGTLQTH